MVQGATNKETAAPVLTGKGLSFIGVTDALGTAQHDTTNQNNLFNPNTGSRNQQDPGVADRWTVGEFYGRRALQSVRRAGEIAYLRYGSLWLPTLYTELGFRVSCYIPSSFRLVNSSGEDINGKTMFGLICGPGIGYQPGSAWPANIGNRDQVAVASLQGGAALGLNLAYDQSGNAVRFVSYLHAPGGKGAGGVWQERANKYSHLWAISGYQQDDGIQGRYSTNPLPRDQWFTMEIYAKMDTSLNPPNGVFETWIERSGVMTKEQWAYDLDMGGTRANRISLGLVRRENTSEDSLPDSTAAIGPLYSTSGGGWGLHGIFARDMLGGGYVAQNIPTSTSYYYGADWALYAKQGASPTRTLNVSGNAALLFNPQQWQNGSMVAGRQNVPGTFAAVHHDAANGISECTLIDDSNFGVFPGTGAPVKVLRTHMFDPTGTPVDVGGGNRGEVYYAFANSSGTAIRYNANSTGETYWYFGFMIDDAAAAWQTPSGFFKIIQHHDTSAHPGPSPDGGPWMIHINSSRQIYMRVRGGTAPSSGDHEDLLIPSQVPLQAWCHVIIKNIWSHVDGQALTQLWYRYDGVHTSWQNGPSTTRSNRYLVRGVADAPYLKMGVYRENEATSITNPYAAVIRSFVMVSSTLAAAVPFQGWAVPGGEVSDPTPDPFAFTDQSGVEPSTLITSDIVQVTGVSNGTAVSIFDGGYRIGDAGMVNVRQNWGATAGTINNGEYIQVRQNSSGSYSSPDVCTLTVGTYSTDWTVTTRADTPQLPINLADYDLIWNDEFDGAAGALPGSSWHPFTNWEGEGAATPWGPWRDAYYDYEHAEQSGSGYLSLTGDTDSGDFTTSTLATYDPADIGNALRWSPAGGDLFIEFSVNVSQFRRSGPWCAVWLYESFGGDDEIDLFEYFNYPGLENAFNTALHGAAGGSSLPPAFHDAADFGVNLQADVFVPCQVHWKQSQTVDFYINNSLVRSVLDTTKVPMNPQGLRISIEYDAPPSVWTFGEDINDRPNEPCELRVGHVRVYRKRPSGTLPVIVDTDISGDVDDVGALAVLCRLHNLGECNILAVGTNVWNSYAVSAASAVMDFYGLGSIPIGKQWQGANSIGTETDGHAKHLHDTFSPSQTSATATSSVTLYRQALASATDSSVVFITLGPLHQLRALLDSAPDGISSLSGEELFNQKVLRVHTMGGQYPSSNGSAEYNFRGDGYGAHGHNVFPRITVPVTFNGYEVGRLEGGWGAGAALEAENKATNPVAAAYGYWFEYPQSWVNGGVSSSVILDWSTWDPICAYTAVRGTAAFTVVNPGSNSIQTDGNNTWVGSPDLAQSYLTENTPAATFAQNSLEPLMLP